MFNLDDNFKLKKVKVIVKVIGFFSKFIFLLDYKLKFKIRVELLFFRVRK